MTVCFLLLEMNETDRCTDIIGLFSSEDKANTHADLIVSKGERLAFREDFYVEEFGIDALEAKVSHVASCCGVVLTGDDDLCKCDANDW